MSKYDYDLFVIGAGSGGVRAARFAAESGANVGIAENFRLGGTCVNQGCVPKKFYYYGAHYHEDFKDARAYGWDLAEPQFSWQRLQENKNKRIELLNKHYAKLLDDAGVKIHQAHASFCDEQTIELSKDGSSYRVSAEKILITTGSRFFVPKFAGEEYVTSSDDIFAQSALPKSIVVVGGGYIAVEFAGIFKSLGLAVKLVYRGDLFLRRFDLSIRKFFQEELEKKGIELLFGRDIEKIMIEKIENQGEVEPLHVYLNDGQVLTCDQVFYATGRIGNTKNLGLENIGIDLAKNGNINVDSQFRTNVPSIFALGDVTGGMQLTPVAIVEAMHFVRSQIKGEDLGAMNYEFIPTTVFSQPSIATVGLSEEEARKKYKKISVYESNFRALKNTLSENTERIFMKLLVDDSSDLVLGAHLVGAEAGEIMQGLAIALKIGLSKKMLDSCIGIHPTSAEEFIRMS